jgi:hypothetical protein
LNLNVHFHTLALDGVYEEGPGQQARFRPLPPPNHREVEWVARRVVRGVTRLLVRLGLGPDVDPTLADPLPAEDPLLAALYGASVQSCIATGRRAGQRVLRFGDPGEAADLEEPVSSRCVTLGGFSIHAEVGVSARDRRRLERLCRYVGRPPLATGRLSLLGDGRLLYRLKRRWRDGTTHVVFEPMELLEKLAALVPPPRIHQVRYHGILGPAAQRRASVVPAPPAPGPGGSGPTGKPDRSSQPSPAVAGAGTAPAPKNLAWADLIRRVFQTDALECPRCGGPMRIMAAIQTPQAIRDILEHLGLPSRPPPIVPALLPPEGSPELECQAIPEEAGAATEDLGAGA